ncbi:MAG: polysaccharide deacetylase family protein [Actinobacteria bacterium]|nr:polysaccharide deacetylase family protein [Actinomycetota bacterium]
MTSHSPAPTRPIGALSLDLDNKWSYLKTHGDPGWEALPSYLDLVVARVLPFLEARDLRITFFLVGQDAALPHHHDALRAIAEAGHEIGNHSFHHEPWLHLYGPDEIEREIASADEHIEEATGRRPVGFRGPGFSVSQAVLDTLQRRGYAYDATTFPNVLNPLARLYYLSKSNLDAGERERRKALFGSASDGLRPNSQYRWELGSGTLPEIPVSTMPLLKVPIHFSYLIYLAQRSPSLALAYFRSALWLYRRLGTAPSLLLHPLDFLGADDDRDLRFFPGMGMHSEDKLAFIADAVDVYRDSHTIVPVCDLASRTSADGAVRRPDARLR